MNAAGYLLKNLLGIPDGYPVAHVRTDPTSLSITQLLAGVLLSVTDHLRVYSYEPTGLRRVTCALLLLLCVSSLGHVGKLDSSSQT